MTLDVYTDLYPTDPLPLAGSVAAVSGTSGKVTVRVSAAGGIPVTSAVSGVLAGTSTMAGVAVGASEASGRVILHAALAGTVDTVSAVAGAIQSVAVTTTTTTTATTTTTTTRTPLGQTVNAIPDVENEDLLRVWGDGVVPDPANPDLLILAASPDPDNADLLRISTTTTTTTIPPPEVEIWRPPPVTARYEGGGWTAHLVATLTGQVTPTLKLLGGSWTDGPLNDATSGNIRVPVEELRRYGYQFWSKWSGSVLLCWRGSPIVLGPILADPSGWGTVDLKFGGLFSLLEWRYATNRNYFPGAEEVLAASVLAYSGMNLGGIAADLTWRSMDRPNGQFPFAVASPNESGTVNRIRNYIGHNISNNSVAKLVKEITAVINGPDVAYRPEWMEPGATVRWTMFHGTEGMPQVGQEHTFTIDLTAPRARLMEPSIVKESTQISRAYMTGQGEGETTEMVIVDRDNGVPAYLPMLETVASDTQATNKNGLLTERGKELVRPEEIIQMSVNLPADDHVMPLSTWFTGDEFIVRVPELLHIRRGVYRMRVVSRSGSITSNVVKCELQPEALIQR